MKVRTHKYQGVSRWGILILVLCCLGIRVATAQSIKFSIYVNSELNATRQQDLDFGTVIIGQGLTQVNLGDPGMGVFSVTGNQDFDIVVDLAAPANLTHDGASSDVIPLTINLAYANHGVNDVNDAVLVAGSSTRFPIFERGDGVPGPPPKPPHGGYTTPQKTAYIYLYGSIDVGNVDEGSYSGTVTLTVNYD